MILKTITTKHHSLSQVKTILLKGWYSGILFIGFAAALISCENHRNPKMVKMAAYIDSINTEFGKDLTYDTLKLAEINRLIAVSDSINYPEGEINLAITASNIYMSYFKNEQALKMLIKSQETMSKVDDKELEALINFHFGKLNRMIKNFDLAMDYFLNAVELSLAAKDSALYSKLLTNIGNLHLEKGPMERAKENFMKAIEIDQVTGNLENLIMNYHQMSVFYHRTGDMDSAQIYLDRVFQLSKESDNQLLFVYYLANSAAVSINNNDLDAGEIASRDALQKLDSVNQNILARKIKSIIYANFGVIYQRRENFDKSITYFNLALEDSLNTIEPLYRIDFVYNIYKNYRQLKDHEMEHKYLDRYIALRNWYDKALADQNLMAIELKYNYGQLQKEHEHQRSRMRFILIISGLIIGFGVFVLILLNQKQRIKIRNTLLTQLEI